MYLVVLRRHGGKRGGGGGVAWETQGKMRRATVF